MWKNLLTLLEGYREFLEIFTKSLELLMILQFQNKSIFIDIFQ